MGWDLEITWHRFYQRSDLPAVAHKRGDAPEKEWKMKNVYGFLRSEQMLPKGWFPPSEE
jgi:hypothetical protein